MKRIILILPCLFLFFSELNAQMFPINRFTQNFWSETAINAPFSISQSTIDRNKMGKRLLIFNNPYNNPVSVATPLHSPYRSHIPTLLYENYSFLKYPNIILDYVNPNSFILTGKKAFTFKNKEGYISHFLNMSLTYARYGFENSKTDNYSSSPVSEYIIGNINYSRNLGNHYYESKTRLDISQKIIAGREFMGNRSDAKISYNELNNNAIDNMRIYKARQILSNTHAKIQNNKYFQSNKYFNKYSIEASNTFYSEQSYRGNGNELKQNQISSYISALVSSSKYPTYQYSINLLLMNRITNESFSGYDFSKIDNSAGLDIGYVLRTIKKVHISVNWRSDYYFGEKLVSTPEIRFDFNLPEKNQLVIEAKRFYYDDKSLLEHIKPLLFGNRELVVNETLTPENGYSTGVFFHNKKSKKVLIKVGYNFNYHENKWLFDASNFGKTLSVKQVSGFENIVSGSIVFNDIKFKKFYLSNTNTYKYQKTNQINNNFNQPEHAYINKLHIVNRNKYYTIKSRKKHANAYTNSLYSNTISFTMENTLLLNVPEFGGEMQKHRLFTDLTLQFNPIIALNKIKVLGHKSTYKLDRATINISYYDVFGDASLTPYRLNPTPTNNFEGITSNHFISPHRFRIGLTWFLYRE